MDAFWPKKCSIKSGFTTAWEEQILDLPATCMRDICLKEFVNKVLLGKEGQQIDAVAVTTMPGREICLKIGLDYAKKFCVENNLPLIPVHHMRAHAVVARMSYPEDIKYPFLTLLISGGHCLIAVVQSPDVFYLLGKGIDIAPGHFLDCVAHEMELSSMPDFKNKSGGAALDELALRGDPDLFPLNYTGIRITGGPANFSFCGVLNAAKKAVNKFRDEATEKQFQDHLPHMAASSMRVVSRHLMHKVTRCMFALYSNRLHVNRTLVVSGGCASSKVLKEDFTKLCSLRNYKLFVPPPKVCVDNAVMIGFTAHEMISYGFQPIDVRNIESVKIDGFAQIGHDVSKNFAPLKNRALQISSNYDRLVNENRSLVNEFNCVDDDESFSTNFSILLQKDFKI